jgi:hypothetical protein
MINIKIKSIIKLEKKEPVYDVIGVPKNHNFIANNIVVHNCDLFGRGKAALFVKDRNPVNEAWRLKDFEKIGSYTEFNDADFVDRKLRRHPNFWMMLTAPKPPEKLYNRYLVTREKNIYHSAEEANTVTKQDIYRALLIKTLRDIITKDNSVSIKKIATHIKIETGYVISEKIIKDIIEESCEMIEKIDINEAKDEKKIKRAEQLLANVSR